MVTFLHILYMSRDGTCATHGKKYRMGRSMHAAFGCMHAAPHTKRAHTQVSTYVSYDSANQIVSLSLRDA